MIGCIAQGGIQQQFKAHTEGKILDGSTGDVAVDQNYRYKEDIDNLANMGMKAHRFFIVWSRNYRYKEDIDNLASMGMKAYRFSIAWSGIIHVHHHHLHGYQSSTGGPSVNPVWRSHRHPQCC